MIIKKCSDSRFMTGDFTGFDKGFQFLSNILDYMYIKHLICSLCLTNVYGNVNTIIM